MEGKAMEKVLITCPFTGLEFEAIKYADGRLVTTNLLTGEDMHITYNSSCNRYMIDPKEFRHTPLVTMAECAEYLDVSKPMITKLAKAGTLQAVRPGASVYITKDSMLEYACKRKHTERSKDGAGTN